MGSTSILLAIALFLSLECACIRTHASDHRNLLGERGNDVESIAISAETWNRSGEEVDGGNLRDLEKQSMPETEEFGPKDEEGGNLKARKSLEEAEENQESSTGSTPDMEAPQSEIGRLSAVEITFLYNQKRFQLLNPYMNTQGCHETLNNMRAQTCEPHKKSSETEMILAHHGLSMNGRPSSDGYNWKKYGQKQLKGTELLRSYYKCTHPHCFAKKHVECSHEGEITEIIYKGEHNHPKPQTTRILSRNPTHMMIQERGIQLQAHEENVDSDKNSADFSSSSVLISQTGLTATPEQSFCSPSDDEEGETKSDCDEEQESNRRMRMESGGEMPHSYPVPITTVREPYVVVETVSEVDIVNDGYRWRKYGQKMVKGHTFPRHYYKCTILGCGVRKHVERSSADPRLVRTTYEGKHNHNVPLTRGSA